jgi:chromosome segregation ATPase
LAAALKEKARATVHDLNLIASLKEDKESLTGQVRQFEEHRDIAAGLIAGLEKDKAAADRATFDAIRTITELRAEFEAFMTNPTSRLLRAKQAENACLAIENGSLKEEVERLRASSFVTAVPCEVYEELKADVKRLEQESAKWRRAEHAVGEKCIEFAKTIQTLKAENERLRKAGDAMHVALLRLTSGTPNWDGKVYWNWNAAKDGKPTK